MSSALVNSSSRSSPGSSRLQFGPTTSGVGLLGGGGFGMSRLRSSSAKKPPEPLRRAVADCLSSPSPNQLAPPSSSSSFSSSDASRTLRDYLASVSTTDLAYSVIIEHTISERERSPAVVARCVALLKRYLLRYRPSEETLQQIDRFCMSIVAECAVNPARRVAERSGSLSKYPASPSFSNAVSPPAPSPASAFASTSLIKSLNYVRSLVGLHIPKRLFQHAAFAGSASASRHALPALSSILKRSFNSQLNPTNVSESSESKDESSLSASSKFSLKKSDLVEDLEYISHDVLMWRWLREQKSRASSERDNFVHPQDMNTHNFLEVGAAALLVGDLEAKMKGQPGKYFGTADMPYLDQLLQPSSVMTVTNSASATSHLRAIMASKRTKDDLRQIWEDSPVSTFRPRARPLFQYRHYSEQQPLRLNPNEVCEVIAVVCSDISSSGNPNSMTVSSKLSNNGKPSMDAAVSVLIKLIIDMYVLDPGIAAPLFLSMLQEILCSTRKECRTRAFDLIINLGVHAHLLEPVMTDDAPAIEDEYFQESYFDGESQLTIEDKDKNARKTTQSSPAIEDFETWILNILHEILLFLVQLEEKEESVWASALSSLLYFVCSRGKISRKRLDGLDIRVVRSFLEISRMNSWAEIVHCKLISMLTNMFYELPEEPFDGTFGTPIFRFDQVDLIGGIEFIFLEYSLANSREERRNLYLVLFDYVIHQINETCMATGISEYSVDEIQPLATLLTLVDAPEAFYISVKLGVQGLGEILRRSISESLDRYPNSERLNMLLENITERYDVLVSSYTHLDKEFSHMIQITKSYKLPKSIEDPYLRTGIGLKVNQYWSTLHSLLHSDRITCRQNGYIWLGDLLISEIGEEKDSDIWSNIKTLQKRISRVGVADSSVASDIPLPIWLFCRLLKSKNSFVRWGFLFVLDRLLMRCKFLLDEKELMNFSSSNPENMQNGHVEKAYAVIDIMSSALLLLYQINETDRINILKMCDILFSQVCLKVPPTIPSAQGDGATDIRDKKIISNETIQKKNSRRIDPKETTYARPNDYYCTSSPYSGTASMAALLLQGHAVVPMQLIARIPAALFFWPLMQLASATTDNIALGVAVGSKGRGNLPGAASDIRATLLLLLIGKCTADHSAFQEVGGGEFFRELLDDRDSRVAYYSSAFLLKRMMMEKPEKYQHMLQNLVFKAQQSNNEKLLENPYLQMRGILQLANDLGIELWPRDIELSKAQSALAFKDDN
ncbi:hypothetical protein SAY87_002685 [Trapa incisa]|uniref:Uncharacterized protein n=1 Tax=Trapa incisa TaxID=236973 RepID=A0AAN7JUU4_9MYRT|nr:hypothetical protein SAY87_002685 [Trapa incisa]